MTSTIVRFAEPVVGEKRRRWRLLVLVWMLVAATSVMFALSLG
jgi:hypothetical protein